MSRERLGQSTAGTGRLLQAARNPSSSAPGGFGGLRHHLLATFLINSSKITQLTAGKSRFVTAGPFCGNSPVGKLRAFPEGQEGLWLPSSTSRLPPALSWLLPQEQARSRLKTSHVAKEEPRTHPGADPPPALAARRHSGWEMRIPQRVSEPGAAGLWEHFCLFTQKTQPKD